VGAAGCDLSRGVVEATVLLPTCRTITGRPVVNTWGLACKAGSFVLLICVADLL
jgi:hypothetical protein